MAAVPLTVDFAQVKSEDVGARVADLVDVLEAADAAGWYGALTVERP